MSALFLESTLFTKLSISCDKVKKNEFLLPWRLYLVCNSVCAGGQCHINLHMNAGPGFPSRSLSRASHCLLWQYTPAPIQHPGCISSQGKQCTHTWLLWLLASRSVGTDHCIAGRPTLRNSSKTHWHRLSHTHKTRQHQGSSQQTMV